MLKNPLLNSLLVLLVIVCLSGCSEERYEYTYCCNAFHIMDMCIGEAKQKGYSNLELYKRFSMPAPKKDPRDRVFEEYPTEIWRLRRLKLKYYEASLNK